MLAEQTPTTFVAFDLLALDDESLLALPQRERRDRLVAFISDPLQLCRQHRRTPPRPSRGSRTARA